MGKDKRGMATTSVRIPPLDWAKLSYLAAERRCTRPDIIRCLIADAVKDVKPPDNAQTIEILGTAQEVAAWSKAAAAHDTDVPTLIRKVLNKLSNQT